MALANLIEHRKSTLNCNCIILRAEHRVGVRGGGGGLEQGADENLCISDTGSSNWGVDNISLQKNYVILFFEQISAD
jgi:hypothetical protein